MGLELAIAQLRCGSCRIAIPKKESYSEMLREAIGRGWVLRGKRFLCGRCRVTKEINGEAT